MIYKTKGFAKLQEKWYKKLKKEGFVDLEDVRGNLWTWSSFYFSCRYTPDRFHDIERFYQEAEVFLHEHPFKNVRDRAVWELFCQGKTVQAISKALKARHFKLVSNTAVFHIINRLTKEMKKKWVLKNKT